MWRKLNTRRQWDFIDKDLCQVCAQPAADPDGRLPWILTSKVYQPIGENLYGTTAPPTCRRCTELSLVHCPQLQVEPTIITAGFAEQVGVLGTVFRIGLGGTAIKVKDDVYVGWDEFARLTHVLGRLAVVRLHDVRMMELRRAG